MVGAWVLDTEHGWNELHPVWRLTGKLYKSGPQYGGSPAGDRSKNGEQDCRDQNGHVCVGYNHHSTAQPPAPPPASSTGGSSSPTTSSSSIARSAGGASSAARTDRRVDKGTALVTVDAPRG